METHPSRPSSLTATKARLNYKSESAAKRDALYHPKPIGAAKAAPDVLVWTVVRTRVGIVCAERYSKSTTAPWAKAVFDNKAVAKTAIISFALTVGTIISPLLATSCCR